MEQPEPPVSQDLPEPPVSQDLPEPPVSQDLPDPSTCLSFLSVPSSPSVLNFLPREAPLSPGGPFVGVSRPGSAARVTNQGTRRRWTETMLEWGPRPALEPPPWTDAHPDRPLWI